MENASLVNGLLLPFKIEALNWSIYSTVNLILALLGTIGLGIVSGGRMGRFARPALIVALLANFIFQWPLAIFSPIIERSLPSYRFFALALHLQISICLLWVFFTPQLSEMAMPSSISETRGQAGTSGRTRAVLCLLAIGLTGIYLSRVNLRCTGFYAALTDPSLTLLARELSGKLIGAGAATYGYGLLANVICPLIVFASIDRIQDSSGPRQFITVSGWFILGAAAIIVILLPGSKGNLIPAIIVVGVSTLASRRTHLGRIVAIAFILGAGLILMTTLEMLRERKVPFGRGYDFGACAAQMNLCSEAKVLLDSMSHKDMSLGVYKKHREKLAVKLEQACAQAADLSGRFPFTIEDNNGAPRPPAYHQTDDSALAMVGSNSESRFSAALVMVSSVPKKSKPKSLKIAIRVWQYARAIGYRAAVVPLQVASWYYLYTTDYGAPGVNALPMANRLFGHRIIMPKRIHEVYYPIYSLGDKTSSGTAPTSFIMAYPAYLGFLGIALSLAGLIGFDLIASLVLGRCAGSLRWSGIGLVTVGCINFILSDFGTTLLTHGSGFALMLLMGLSVLENKMGRE